KQSIWDRMKHYKVPGCSVSLVQNDGVAWACGYGWLEKGGPVAAKPESRFQAASVSKSVSAVGVMKVLNDRSDVSLQSDIRDKLGWKLEALSCLDVTKIPTIEHVLSHRGGIIGKGSQTPKIPLAVCGPFEDGGGGFNGYKEGQTVPSLIQV